MPQIQSQLRRLQSRVKERWGRMMEDELAKMETHRQELIGAVHPRTPTTATVEQGIEEIQPGLS